MRNTWHRVLILCLALLLSLLAVISGCAPAATPIPTLTPAEPTLTPVESTPAATQVLETVEPLFVLDHLIVTGPTGLVDEVINTVSGANELEAMCPSLGLPIEATFRSLPRLEERDRFSLWYVEALLDTCEGLPQFEAASVAEEQGWALDDWVMVLYGITGDVPLDERQVAELAAAINCVSEDMCGLAVLAEPIYRSGRSPVTGNPWIGEGSPWIGEGSPIPGTAPAITASDAFWTQWAFRGAWQGQEPVGIGLVTVIQEGDSITHSRTVEYTGDDVRVGVFDTSPFDTTGEIAVDWVTPTLTLTVSNPGGLEQCRCPSAISNHGLFVAGLTHAVAPGTEIHLYQVLDEEGRGDLWTLNVALHTFISETLAISDTLDGAVISLSLGSYPPQDYLQRLWHLVQMGSQDVSEVTHLLLAEVTSLKTLLSAAYCRGMVVVAAAGNDSYWARVGGEIVSPQVPASFTEIIAVGSTGAHGRRACYSNWADVAAPGGGAMDAFLCEPQLDTCSELNDCQYAVIGLVRPSCQYPTGYAYWAGTSFSVPLVSGLAALILEAEGGWADPEVVRDRITGAAAESDLWVLPGSPPGKDPPGVINVPMSLRQ